MRKKHVIFWDYFISNRFGGPTGYLAHLRSGLDGLELDREQKVEFFIDALPESEFPTGNKKQPPTEEDISKHIRYFENPDNFELSNEEFGRLTKRGPNSVHLHTTPLAYKVFRSFKRHGVTDIPIILTSHTPESNGKEMADQYRVHSIDDRACKRLEDAVRFIEALAFQASDIWIFPSIESMDPYYATIPKFSNWARNKDIRFIPTGASLPRMSVEKNAAKAKFGLAGKKVVSFIGRHNEVKGYDLFCSAMERVLEQQDDLAVLVAGPENPALPAPKRNNWIELGWYSFPGDVLAASDLFILPNKMTYFDLVLIEAVGMGVPTLASNTGGNVTMERLTKGVIRTFEPTPSILSAEILNFFHLSEEEVRAQHSKLLSLYNDLFTPVSFARGYVNLINQIYADYGMFK
ncbi:glycosyltransferase family 4 protein [Rhizobiales bacterium TNE-4]|nr:glycosyltransferase family 4 protein [Rhizobiales bacterium TNE-4]MBV1827558.1 glycosyltransferase family 4 protein [Rhizobiales bacterium TNE-4]